MFKPRHLAKFTGKRCKNREDGDTNSLLPLLKSHFTLQTLRISAGIYCVQLLSSGTKQRLLEVREEIILNAWSAYPGINMNFAERELGTEIGP